MDRRSAAFLLPKALDGFILEDFVRPLVNGSDVCVIEPGRLPAGAFVRLPGPAGWALAAARASGIKTPFEPAVFILMHPVLWPLASALLKRNPKAQLWYSIWDRYDHALDANPAMRAKISALHRAASDRADWRFAVSTALAQIEADSGRSCDVMTIPHERFPAPDPRKSIVVTAMGHLGRRTDWALLRMLVKSMPELTLVLIGHVHREEAVDPQAMTEVLEAPNCVDLGRLGDDAAARVIGMSDACLLPFIVEPFNDAGLPQRILKAARLGRKTLTPPLSGSLTQAQAITVCESEEAWLGNLRALGERASHGGDDDLRRWALDQDSERLLAPVRDRLASLGVRAPA